MDYMATNEEVVQTRSQAAGIPPSAILAKPPAPATGTLWHPPDERRASPGGGRRASLQPPPPPVKVLTSAGRESIAATNAAVHRVLPDRGVKLVTPQLQFASDLAATLGGCLEVANLVVVGVLGLEGVGKSTILSLVGRNTSSPASTPLFRPQSLASAAALRHETTGVDLAVLPASGGRHLVLLDSQPLLSSSVLADALARGEPPRFGAPSVEQQADAAARQLAAFLLATCHYVVVVHDALAADAELVQFLWHVQRQLEQCRVPHVSGAVARDKHVAELLFVANGVAEGEVVTGDRELLRRHARALEVLGAPPGRLHRTRSSLVPLADDRVPLLTLPLHPPLQNPELKPTWSEDERFRGAAERLGRFIHALPSDPSFGAASAARPSTGTGIAAATTATSLPPRPLTLREWISNAARVLDAVRKSGVWTADDGDLR